MKQEQLEIINLLIKNRFDIDNFKNFVARVLNVRVGNRNESEAIWKEYQDYIESYFTVSDYRDKDDKKIYILAVKIKDYYIKNGEKLKIDPTRARTKQRNFIATMLKKYSKHGSLVAFYNDVRTDWRLSFVKLDYSFTSEGIQEKFTPSKRASYLVGEGEASHTVIKQFSQLIGNAEESSLSQIENLFQLEKVTDEFFEEYKNKYLDLKLYLEENEIFKSEALKHTANIEQFSEEFSKKLMGQLAFLYFLQKKGWLGVKIVPQKIGTKRFKEIYGKASPNGKELLDKVYKRVSQEEYKLTSEVNSKEINCDVLAECFKNTEFDEPWGVGQHNFIRTLFDRHIEINEKRKETEKEELNFFNDYLEHFFYEALNQNRGENQYFPKFNCKIPFLNGGLFEPFDGYDWENTDFKIPDEMFSNKKENGILDVFDRFNFTIAENEPFETEVAVDPEMLGKVFENLLDVKDRKSKGAFYTPREIVHYMCKESLTNYLVNEVTEVNKEDVEQLLQMGEFTKDYDTHIFEMEYKQGKRDNDWGLPKTLLKNIEKIDKALQNVKIADPAIGSGAFPLGMLNEIVKVRNIITEYMLMSQYFRYEKVNELDNYWDFEDKLRKQRSLYNLKIETIENSLFGVDIEPSAVEIAKLRLWLSIVVDTTNENIQPLPNLDFNFMVGNSLLDEFEGIKLFDESLLENSSPVTLKLKQMSIFEKPVSLGETFLKEIKLLHKQFFSSKNQEEKKEIKKEIEKKEWELITVTLKETGNESKIKELEKLQKEKRKPYFLWKLEFAEVFQEKGGFDIVIGNPPYVKYENLEDVFKIQARRNYECAEGFFDIYQLFLERGFLLSKNKGFLVFIFPSLFLKGINYCYSRKYFYEKASIKIIKNYSDNVFENVKMPTCVMMIEKLINKNNIIKCYRRTMNGFKSYEILQENIGKDNYNYAFDDICNKIKTKNTKLENYIDITRGLEIGRDKKVDKNIENGIGIVFGQDMSKYEIKNISIIDKETYEQFKKKEDIFFDKKLLIRETGNEITATFDDKGCITNRSIYCIRTKKENLLNLIYLLSLINSKLLQYYYCNEFKSDTNVFPKIRISQVKEIPIKEISEQEQIPFIVIVEKIMSLKSQGKDTTDLENQIDEMVYDLYELTEEEKEVVRNFRK